jgi:hypothetical protein
MISDNVEFLRPIFYAVSWQTFWKFWKCRIAPLIVTYHYVKFYVSIIIHLEVVNINVRNFNFPTKWPPQYRTNSTLSDINDISYVGRLWCPEFIPDIEKFLLVAICKMAATIPHKFNIVRFPTHISNLDDIGQCWIFAVLWWPFWKWRSVEIFQCRDIIIYPHIKFWWYWTMLNFYCPFFMPCLGRHFENFENAELLR